MRKWRWIGFAGVVLIIAAIGIWLDPCRLRQRPAPPGPSRDPACVARHGFIGPSELTPILSGSNCRPEGCGLNGAWLGRGVPFRELHPSRRTTDNPDLDILSFRKNGQFYTFHVDEDSDAVRGFALGPLGAGQPAELTPETLVGAELRLGRLNRQLDIREEYVLRFEEVTRTELWARCPRGTAPAGCRNTPARAWLYRFTVTSLRDGCIIELCKPGLDENFTRLEGTVVIFRGKGDVYDERYTVDPATRTDKADVVNFACTGTTISKMHLLRHTSASMAGSTYVSMPRRQAMMRLLPADYCGVGRPFTEDNVPVGIDLAYFILDPVYTTDPRATGTDALWNDARATCVEQPRLLNHVPNLDAAAFRAGINTTCANAGKPLPQTSCEAAPARAVPIYATSRNPGSS